MTALQSHFGNQRFLAWVVTITAIALPHIAIDGKHLLLFNFYAGRFELLFRVWEVSPAYLSAIFLLFALGVILFFSFTYSRYFCGNICPKSQLYRLFHDVIEAKLFKMADIKNRQRDVKIEKNIFMTSLAYLLLMIISFVSIGAFLFYLMPAPVLFEMIGSGFKGQFLIPTVWTAGALYLFAEILFFKSFFCNYLCPYQLACTVTVIPERSYYDFHTAEECINCNACVRICPVPELDIKVGFDTRCISCGDCSAVCQDVMRQEGYNGSLIAYRTFEKKRHHPFFSFSDPFRSLLFAIGSVVLVGIMIAYLSSEENLGYCRFINADLYSANPQENHPTEAAWKFRQPKYLIEKETH